ncbi:hypothetical protein D0Y65_027256, partial [Glycine soja]
YPIFAIQTAQLTKKTYISPRILLHPPPLENQQSHTPNLHTLQYLNFSPLKLPYRRRLHCYASLKLVRVCYVQSLFVIVIFLELVRDLRQHHLRSSNNIRFAESDLRTDTYEDIEIREGIEADIGEHFSSMHIAEEEDFPMIYVFVFSCILLFNIAMCSYDDLNLVHYIFSPYLYLSSYFS